jgi:hypothetical protein
MPNLSDIDLATWKADRNACQNKRQAILPYILKHKQELKAITENNFIKTFGRPDAQVLKSSNTKTYIYYLSPGEQCHSKKWQKIITPSIAFHFSAIGLVVEITQQKGNP